MDLEAGKSKSMVLASDEGLLAGSSWLGESWQDSKIADLDLFLLL
jgi:hypothetical protein